MGFNLGSRLPEVSDTMYWYRDESIYFKVQWLVDFCYNSNYVITSLLWRKVCCILIILGDGRSTAVLPRCYRGRLTIAKCDHSISEWSYLATVGPPWMVHGEPTVAKYDLCHPWEFSITFSPKISSVNRVNIERQDISLLYYTGSRLHSIASSNFLYIFSLVQTEFCAWRVHVFIRICSL